MRASHRKPKGISLIVTVTFMMIIAIMAVTFSRLSMYEQAATGNYAATVEAKFAAFAGIDFAIAKITQDLRTYGYVRWPNNFSMGSTTLGPTLYPSTSNTDLLTATDTAQNVSLHRGTLPFSYSGAVGRAVVESGVSKTIGTYDYFGNTYALKIRPFSGKLNVNSHIAIESAYQGRSNVVLRAILKSLAVRCGVTNPDTIVNLIRTANFAPPAAKPNNYKAFANMGEVTSAIATSYNVQTTSVQKFLDNLCTDSWINPNTVATFRASPADYKENPSFYQERRAPININTISEDLLYAVISNIKACVILNDTSTLTDTKTGSGSKPRVVAINFGNLAASTINTLIYNGATRRTFETQKTIDDCIDGLNLSGAISEDISWAWDSTNTKAKACRDALKSALNPGHIDNYWNPTGDAYRLVCKGDIYFYNKTTPTDPNNGMQGHATEFCTSHFGEEIEIVSLGRITAAGRTKTIATYQITQVIKCTEVMTHSSQKDFASNLTASSNIVLFPNTESQDRYGGWIELKPVDVPTADSPLFGFSAQSNTTGNISNISQGIFSSPLSYGTNFKISTLNPKPMYKATLRSETGATDVKSNVLQDGIVSRYRWYIDELSSTKLSNTAYLLKHAIKDYTKSPEAPDLRNLSGSYNAGNYKGTVEFWIKLSEYEFGLASKNIASGLFQISTRSGRRNMEEHHAISETAHIDVRKSFYEGNVLIGYINTQKSLCLSRLYWAVYWDNTRDPDSVNSNTLPGRKAGWIGSKVRKYSDPKRRYARTDIEVGNIDWQPHEWHHVRICWNDEDITASTRLELYLDGVKKTPSGYPKIHKSTDYDPSTGEYTVLNHENPQDAFFIGGILRKQDPATTSSTKESIFPESNDRVDFPGNITMDNFVSWGTHRSSSGIPTKRFSASGFFRGNFLAPGFLFSPSTFRNRTGIIGRLKESNPVSQFLRSQFSSENQTKLSANTITEEELAKALNTIVKGTSIYTAPRFSGVTLSSKTQQLLQENPSGGDKLIQLNRMLLEDAYPNEIEASKSGNFYLGPLLWTGYPIVTSTPQTCVAGVYTNATGTASAGSSYTGYFKPNQRILKNDETIYYQINLTSRSDNEKKGVTLESVSMVLYYAYPQVLDLRHN